MTWARRHLIALLALSGCALATVVLLWTVGARDTLTLSVFGGSLQLLRPRALYVLIALPLVIGALGASLVDLPRRQQGLSAALRLLFLAALTAALARPSVIDQRHTVATVILVDVSDSITARQLDAAHRFVDQARHARPSGDLLYLCTFARHPRVVPLPLLNEALPPLLRHEGGEGDGSDLEAALALAYGLYPPDTLKRAVIVSDGNETLGNLGAQAYAARDRRVRVHHLSFPGEQDPEVLVRTLTLPADVKVGAPFEVWVDVYASVPQRATVTLFRDEFVNALDGRRTLDLHAGRNPVRFKAEVVQPGFTTFRAVVAAPRDGFAANNQAVASVSVKGKPRVLYIEGEPQSAGYLTSALKRENIDVEVRGAYGLPTQARDLNRYDLVLLSDVASTFVGPQQMSAIEGYVRDLGGGFVMAGGENSFGSGGYSGSRLETLLPVRFDQERKRDQPQLALVLAIDRSGSMTGEKLELAKDAARATAELLGSEDLIGVVAFDSQAQPLVRLQRAANRVRIAGDIARLHAGGGTAILPALKEAYDELDPAHAKIKHVILLTDGQASYDGIAELVDEMAQHRITVSAVGVGAGADKTLLTLIAERGGGRFYYTQDAQNVPKIFTKETTQVARSSLVEQAVGLRVAKHVELLDGINLAEAPALRGYVACKPKPLSEVILVSDLGEPILARWRVGSGQAVAFTSDVKNRWAADWLRWPGYGKFWAHLVRSTMRHAQGAGAGYELSVDLDPPHARVTVDAVSADDRFVSGLSTTLKVIDPAHPTTPLELPLVESASGRYQGDLTLDRYGTYLLRAEHRDNGVVVAESTGAVALPYPREYLALPPDTALLQRVSQVTGGRASPGPAQIFDAAGEQVTYHRELWPFCVWAAALLLLLDVAARRVRLFD